MVEIKHKKLWQVAYRHLLLCDNLHTETSFESKKLHSKLKSRDVVRWFDCTCGKLCDKHGVMLKVTHRHVFVSQKVCRHSSFSVWTRAWTRLVVDTLRENMLVEHKHGKLCDKLYTETSSYVKIYTRWRLVSQKNCIAARLFTENTHHNPSCWSNQCSQTRYCMWKVTYWEGFVS